MQNHRKYYLPDKPINTDSLKLSERSDSELNSIYKAATSILNLEVGRSHEKSLKIIYETNKLDRIEVDQGYVIEYVNLYVLSGSLKDVLALLSKDHIRLHRAVKASGKKLSLQQFYTNKLFDPDLTSQFDELIETVHRYELLDDLTDGTIGTGGDSIIDYTLELLRENGTDDESEHNRNLIHIINSSLFYGIPMNFDQINDEDLRNELTEFGDTELDLNDEDDLDFIRNNVKALIFASNIRDLFNSLENRSKISIRVNYIDISELPPVMKEFRNIIQENIDSLIPDDNQIEKETNEVILRLGL